MFHRFRIAEGGPTGARVDRLAGFACSSDLGHAGGDRVRIARLGAEARTHHHAGRWNVGVAIGEAQCWIVQAHDFARTQDDLSPVQAAGDIAAVGASIHRHRPADSARHAA